jgi:signal transduction histidine kinase
VQTPVKDASAVCASCGGNDAVVGREATAGSDARAGEASVRILVVEDDPQVRRMLALLLGTHWNIQIAEGGEAAWRLVRESPPDLVISDVRMPVVDGITLLRRLRAEAATQDVPVILVSGAAGEQETIAGLEAGADDFLIKPFSGRELLVRVQALLEITAMRRHNAQQEQALASLRRHTRWTERLLDSLPVPLLLLEPSGDRVLFANRAAARLAGATLARGTALGELGPFRAPDEEGGAAIDLGGIASTAAGSRVERRVLWEAGGGPRWLLVDAQLVPGDDDLGPVGVLALREVTELMTTERELRRTIRTRDEFISAASHELRTPITTLILQTESLLKWKANGSSGAGEERLGKRLSTIRAQVRRLEQLVDALLDVSRLIEGRLQLHPEEVDLGAIATESVDLLRDAAERSGSAVSLCVRGGVAGRWDRLRIGQVVTNLLSNAIKFGNGRPIEVEVGIEGLAACLRVRDHGQGIPPEERARIFGRFERAASQQHYPGLGLGLWISKQIADACGGSISVDSAPGAGATFTLALPLAEWEPDRCAADPVGKS